MTTTETTITHKDLLAKGYSELSFQASEKASGKAGTFTEHSGIYAKITSTTLDLAFYDGDNFIPSKEMRKIGWSGGYKIALPSGSTVDMTVINAFVAPLDGWSALDREGKTAFNATITPLGKNAYNIRVNLSETKRHTGSKGKVYLAFLHNYRLRGGNVKVRLYIETGEVVPVVTPVKRENILLVPPTPVDASIDAQRASLGIKPPAPAPTNSKAESNIGPELRKVLTKIADTPEKDLPPMFEQQRMVDEAKKRDAKNAQKATTPAPAPAPVETTPAPDYRHASEVDTRPAITTPAPVETTPAPAPAQKTLTSAEKLEILRALAMVQAEYPALTAKQVKDLAIEAGFI